MTGRGPDIAAQRAPRSRRWRGLVLGVLGALGVLGVMWWGMTGHRAPSGADVGTTCVEEQQRCRLGGTKLGLCAELPDGKLHCLSQH